MAAESDIGFVENRIGHCIIDWKIENYSLVTCSEKRDIFSSEFYVTRPQTTKWMMILKPKCKVNKNTFHVTFYLQRLKFNPGPNIVWGNWILTLLDKQEEVYYSTNGAYNFEKESDYGVDLVNKETVFDKLLPFDLDILHIRCQLIVSCEDAYKKFECSDIRLKLLSENLENLYKRGKYHDIFIKTKDKIIRAHKAVLYARNRIFANLIDEAKGRDTIILEQDNDAMEKVIRYLYSGNLESVLSKPSIFLYSCIMYLKIEELMLYYVPDKLMLHTTVDVQEFAFLWLITDFRNRNEDSIVSPVLNKGISEICWRLHLYPKGVGDDVEHIAIFAEIVEGRKQMDVCIEFAVMNKNQELFWSRRLNKSTEGNEMFGCKDFIENGILENSSLLADDTLRIVFKLRILKGEELSSVGNHMMSIINKNINHYHSLSMHMLRMFELVKFQDVVLIADGKHFVAHKFILAARSQKFAKLFDKMSLGQMSLNVANIAPNILRILLHYIYSGILRDFEGHDLLQVYEAGNFFKISQLKYDCSKHLQSNIELENVCSILIFAENEKDKDLKLSAMNFVRMNAQEVFKQQSWQHFTVEKPLYSTEVLNYSNYIQENLMSSTETEETGRNIIV